MTVKIVLFGPNKIRRGMIMSLHLNKMASKSWLVDIAQNKELWAKGEMEDWPSIIAYEYQRLRRLCEKEQSYGVLLCLRDNFESFLKLEVLLSFAWADQYTDEEFRKNVVCQITTQNLSLGQWVELATILIRETVRAGFFIPEEIPLKEVVHYYNKLKIVNWRNRKIGHGAMEFDEDEEFQNDLKQKILELAKLYNCSLYTLMKHS